MNIDRVNDTSNSRLQSTKLHSKTQNNDEDQDTFTSAKSTYTKLDNYDYNPSTSTHDLQHVLQTIEQAARTAGQIALSTAGQIAIQSTKANTRDLVTESDVQCQQIIQEIIKSEFPKELFLGEEDVDLSAGGDSSLASRAALENVLLQRNSSSDEDDDQERLVFIVDPIDGTTNFQAGLPIYAMSIGVVSLSSSSASSSPPQVIAGVIYNPTLNEMTSAVRGYGCYLNNQRIQQSSNKQGEHHDYNLPPRTTLLNQSLINIGFPISKESTLHASSKAITALSTRVRGIRMIACASQAMSWTAQSKFHSYFSWDLNGWDIAAGIVIVEESGGMVSDMRTGGKRATIETRDMVITCPCERRGEEGLLRDELIGVLRENDCLEY